MNMFDSAYANFLVVLLAALHAAQNKLVALQTTRSFLVATLVAL